MTFLVFLFTLLAAVLHVFIFYLEVFAWSAPTTRKIFGPQSPKELEITSFYAYNQGVYNLVLAIIAFVGAVLMFGSHHAVGASLGLAGTGAMLLAAIALGVKSPAHRSAAMKQGAFPALAVICCLISL